MTRINDQSPDQTLKCGPPMLNNLNLRSDIDEIKPILNINPACGLELGPVIERRLNIVSEHYCARSDNELDKVKTRVSFLSSKIDDKDIVYEYRRSKRLVQQQRSHDEASMSSSVYPTPLSFTTGM